MSDAEEYRRLNSLFKETKNKIIKGESFRQQCLEGTHYNSFGWWMRSQQRYMDLSESDKERIRSKIRIVHAVYIHWETIVRNLTDDRIRFLDARKLSIEQLYEAITIDWCYDQDELLRPPGNVPDELLYQEDKYRKIIEFIDKTGILDDIEHDRKECTRFTRRLQRDLGKICNFMKKNTT